MGKFIDMTGWKMWEHNVPDSFLEVIKRDTSITSKKGQSVYWICYCHSCNKICSKDGAKLRNGNTISCGCINRKTINIKNKRFGKLIALNIDFTKTNLQGTYWNCKCDCGNYCSVYLGNLQSGKIKSCGCLHTETRLNNILKENINKRFGNLVAIGPTNEIINGCHVWKFKCDCGKDYYYPLSIVKNNHFTSCGCNQSSMGEKIITKILEENNINYIKDQGYFTDLISPKNRKLRYDFIILNSNNLPIYIIEFDGPQHQKQSSFQTEEEFHYLQLCDKIKNQYALSHNIPLARIPYKELNNLSYDLLFNNKYLIKGENYD